MNKTPLVAAVESLLASARDRNTEQGILVLESILQELDSTNSADGLAEIHAGLNRSLAGIEAHGHFTDEEYKLIQSLRDGALQ